MELEFPPAPVELEFPPAPEPPTAQGPTRAELLKKLHGKMRHGRPRGGRPDMEELSAKLASYTNIDEALMRSMVQETGHKKLAKNPLKFAKRVAAALPKLKSLV